VNTRKNIKPLAQRRRDNGYKKCWWTANRSQGRPATGDNRNSEKANKWTWLDIQNYRC